MDLKLKLFLLIGCFFLLFNLKAQDVNFRYINDKSYEYTLAENWDEVIAIGKLAKQADIDFFYLNLRLGIAYYHKGQHYTSIGYLNKAIKQNANDELCYSFLYWNKLAIGNTLEAFRIYDEHLKDNEEIKKPYPNWVSSIKLAGGYYFASNKNFTKDYPFASVELEHKPTKAFELKHGYAYNNFNYTITTFDQHSYYFKPNFQITKNVSIHTGFLYSTIRGELNQMTLSTDSQLITFPPPPQDPTLVLDTLVEIEINRINSDFLETNYWTFHVGSEQKFNRLELYQNFNVQLSQVTNDINIVLEVNEYKPVQGMQIEPVTTIVEDEIDTTYTNVYSQFTIGAKYTLPFLKDRIRIGADLYVPISSEGVNFTGSPNLTVQLSPSTWFYADYLFKNRYTLTHNRNENYYNQSNEMHMISTSLTQGIKKRYFLIASYQFIAINDSRFNTFNHNGITFGFKILLY